MLYYYLRNTFAHIEAHTSQQILVELVILVVVETENFSSDPFHDIKVSKI